MEMVGNDPSLYRDIIKNLAYPVLLIEIVDEEIDHYRLLEMNEAACALFELYEEELMEKGVMSLLSHLTPLAYSTIKAILLKNGKHSTILDLPVGNGSMIPMEVNASLTRLDGKPIIFCMLKEYSAPCCYHEVLKEENNYLNTIMDTTQSIVLILDKEGRISHWNKFTEAFTGYLLEEVQYMKFWELFLEKDEENRIIDNYLSGKIPTEYENYWMTKNGERKYIKWKNSVFNDSIGNLEYVVATGVDITEQVHSLYELENSKEKYKTLVSSMDDFVFTIDQTLTVMSVFGKWIESNGFTKEMFEGKSIENIFNGSSMHLDAARQALSGKTTEFEWDFKIEGKKHYFHSVLSPIVIKNQRIKKIVGVTRDITEKKTLEDHHKRIYDAVTSGVVLQDSTGKIVYANKNACDILGYSEEALFTMSSMDEEWKAVNDSGEALPGEEHPGMLTLKTGVPHSNVEMAIYNPARNEKRWILVDTKAIFELGSSDKIEYVISTFRDITKKKEMDLLLIQSEKLALVGQLASGIAHEIRNPLTGIMGFLKLIEEGDDKNKLFDFLPVIKTELEQINRFTDEFIELSHSQDDEWADVEIVGIIQSALTAVGTELNNKQITSVIESDFHEGLLLHGIKPQLKQLFINLFKNSIEAMSPAGHLIVKLDRVENKARIRVIDNGKGISQARLKHLCEPYYSIKEKGTGLGLMRCLKVTHQHNGKISFDSEEGKGTVVTIELSYLG
ncbi:PAS domain S-box protein [Lysinibacillus sphaericus]